MNGGRICAPTITACSTTRARRRRDRGIQQDGVQPGGVWAVPGQSERQSRDRRKRARQGATAIAPGVQLSEQDRTGGVGWVQERGLYFLGEKDAKYTDLVAMTDPFKDNPGEKFGALVEGRYGKGRWLYMGLGLWRQLPAGRDGGSQLLANVVALAKDATSH